MNAQHPPADTRRRLLQAAAAAPLALAVPTAPQAAPAAIEPVVAPEKVEPGGRGYRLSAHVQRAYDTSRY